MADVVIVVEGGLAQVRKAPADIVSLVIDYDLGVQSDGSCSIPDGVKSCDEEVVAEVDEATICQGHLDALLASEFPETEETPQRIKHTTDAAALDQISYILSTPDWHVSYLEDIHSIVRGTGRTAVPDADWPQH